MAVPTGQRKSPAFVSQFSIWLKNLGDALGRPLFSVFLALVVSGIVILVTAQADVFSAYYYLYNGSFGSLQSISYTLVKATPLIFAGLSVAIAFRAGLFNIGAAGQLTVGAVTADIIALQHPTWPGWILLPLMLIASALAGAIWGGIVGVLKAWRGAHEVVTTIMLNWIAFYVAAYLINGPFQGPPQQTVPLPAQATLPFVSLFYNQTIGTFLPAIDTPTAYTVDLSIILALLMLVVYWFIVARTTFGYELRVIGQNVKAARYAGISINKNIVMTMVLAGALAGLAGATRLMGQPPYQLISTSFRGDSTGFDAIGVALLGRMTPVGILLSALLFGGLQQAGSSMGLFAHVPGDLIYLIEALALLSVATEFLPALQRLLPRWMWWSRKPPLAPALTNTQETNSARNGNEKPPGQPAESGDRAVTPASQEEQ